MLEVADDGGEGVTEDLAQVNGEHVRDQLVRDAPGSVEAEVHGAPLVVQVALRVHLSNRTSKPSLHEGRYKVLQE